MSSKKLDAAIDALVDALAELPEHELEGWQRGNRLGLRILCELGRRYPGICRRRGRFAASRREQGCRFSDHAGRAAELQMVAMPRPGQLVPGSHRP